MVDVPAWLENLDVSPTLIVASVVVVAAVAAAVVIAGVPSGRAVLPSTLAVFVLAMIVIDWRRRD